MTSHDPHLKKKHCISLRQAVSLSPWLVYICLNLYEIKFCIEMSCWLKAQNLKLQNQKISVI